VKINEKSYGMILALDPKIKRKIHKISPPIDFEDETPSSKVNELKGKKEVVEDEGDCKIITKTSTIHSNAHYYNLTLLVTTTKVNFQINFLSCSFNCNVNEKTNRSIYYTNSTVLTYEFVDLNYAKIVIPGLNLNYNNTYNCYSNDEVKNISFSG